MKAMRNYMKLIFNMLSIILIVFPLQNNAQSIDDLVKIGIENNPGLHAKYKDFEAALQRVAQVNVLPEPTVSFGYFISPVETRVGPQRAKISLTQMFPWYGTLATKEDMFTLLAEAKYQEFLEARNELVFKVKSAYYPLIEVDKLLLFQYQNKEILASYKQLAIAAFGNGKGSMVDALRVDIMIDNIATELKILNDKKKPLLSKFNNLLNRSDTISVSTLEYASIIEIEENYRKDSMLLFNPVLAAFDLKLRAAKDQEELAQKQSMPQFGVGLDYVIVGKRTDMVVPQNGKDVLMPMVSMSLPIYRNKYKSAIKESQFAQGSITANKKDFENNLLSNYEMTWFELKSMEEVIKLNQSQIIKTEQIIDLLIVAYSNSGKEFVEILRMQQDLLRYKMSEATAQKNYYSSLAKLNYLTAQ